MNAKRIIIHIGFPRCGSTLLQREIFPRLDGDVRVVSPACVDRRLIDFLIERFIFSGRNIHLVPVSSAEKTWVNDIMAEYPESQLLISCEGFVGDVFDNMMSLPHLIGALRALFGEPEILLIVRRQSDMVKSYYRHSLEGGCYKSFPAFLGFQRGRFVGFRLGRFAGINVDPAGLNFFNFVSFLESSFGAGKVHVLPYEWIERDFGRFCACLSSIIGVKLPPSDGTPPVMNRGLRNGDLLLLKALNRVWDTRVFGIPLIPRLSLLEHYERGRRGGGLAKRLLLAISARMSPIGAFHVVRPVLSPLLNLLLFMFAPSELKSERAIDKAIDDAMFESNAELNRSLNGILTGLGYCDQP
jgi:hypothetical protein